MRRSTNNWESSSSPVKSIPLQKGNQGQRLPSSEKKRERIKSRCGNTPFRIKSPEESTNLDPTTTESSAKTSNLLSSGGSNYNPSPSQLQKESKSEYTADSEEGIEEIREFVRDNKNKMVEFIDKMDSLNEQSQLSGFCRKEAHEEKGNIFNTAAIFLLSISVVLFCLCVFGGEETSKKTIQKLVNSNCWEQFKKANCNVNNPLSNLCRELYDCFLNQRDKRIKQQDEKGEKHDDSWVEQIVVSLIVSLIGSYYLGVERMRRFFRLAMPVIRPLFDFFKEKPNLLEKK